MKELSIEQKAKAYDELIERLKDLKFAYRFTPLSDTIEEIFPELKESEDERIRKDIICYFKVQQQRLSTNNETFTRYPSWIAWLEKQGEQKPEWSDDDVSMLYGVVETEQYMLDVVNGIKKFDVGNDDIRKACAEELNWLKSLKDRVQPKQ